MIYHVRDDVLCMVLCVVWVIKLLPVHTVLECVTVLETVAMSTVTTHYEYRLVILIEVSYMPELTISYKKEGMTLNI